MSTAASGLRLLLFLQSAMVIFDLAWMMSKDLNDMLWYVVPSQGQCHTWLLSPSNSVIMHTCLVSTGNIACGPFLGMYIALVFFLTVRLSRQQLLGEREHGECEGWRIRPVHSSSPHYHPCCPRNSGNRKSMRFEQDSPC